ncbi:MAG TPA: hypothetical protein VFO60_07660 [Candidatus Dormibacteraeota bacterium]|nr:hypothetical protein [Candidatus Dormibacteraeota bacterium]
MTQTEQAATAVLARARDLARRRHRPVYVRGQEVFDERPTGRVLTVWPSGDVTVGNPIGGGRLRAQP